MGLKVRVTQNRSFSRMVHLIGRLDNDTVGVLDAELKQITQQQVDVVVFELEHLEYISSAGLRSIFAVQKLMASRDGRIVLMNAQPPVRKVFEIVQATELSEVFSSVAELDRYLDTMQYKVRHSLSDSKPSDT